MTVPAGESRAILVQACARGDATPGTRSAAVAIEMDGQRIVPVRLRVSEVAIPATASLPTTFGLASRGAALGHLRRSAGEPEELLQFDRLYRTALLAHRISVHGGTWDPPPFRRKDGSVEVDFRTYDREVLPFLQGKVLDSGARATTVELRTHPGLRADGEKLAYWRAQADHLRERGFEGVLFSYEKDEPSLEELPATTNELKQLVPELERVTDRAPATFTRTPKFVDAAQPAVKSLSVVLQDLNPMLTYMKPYAPEIGVMWRNIGLSVSAEDSLGHILRVMTVFSGHSLNSPVKGMLPGMAYNPYPAPGAAQDNPGVSFTGQYPRVTRDPLPR
jgi:hypothetical protein